MAVQALNQAIHEVFLLIGVKTKDFNEIASLASLYASDILNSEAATIVSINQLPKCFALGREWGCFVAYDGAVPPITQFYECIKRFGEWKASQKNIAEELKRSLPLIVEKPCPTRREMIEEYFAMCQAGTLNELNSIGLEDLFDLFRPHIGISIEDMKMMLEKEISEIKPRLRASVLSYDKGEIYTSTELRRIDALSAEEVTLMAKSACRRRMAIVTMARHSHLTQAEFGDLIFSEAKFVKTN